MSSSEEKQYKHQPTKADTERVKGFFTNPVEEQARLLKEAEFRLSPEGQELTRRKLQTINDNEERTRKPVKVHYVGSHGLMHNYYLEFDLRLDDNLYRLVIIDRYGGVEIFNGQGFESPDLKIFSRHARLAEEMKEWPGRLTKRNYTSKKWKKPWTSEVCVVLMHYDDDKDQYWFETSSKPFVTYWFKDRYRESERGEDWLRVKPGLVSLGKPWEKPGEGHPNSYNVITKKGKVCRAGVTWNEAQRLMAHLKKLTSWDHYLEPAGE